GLYLSDHPMGEVADRVGLFVTAYSGDLKDESLDGQRVVVGGIVTGVRTVVTRNKDTMGVVTLEDLQGTIEVVVFPRLHAQTSGTWTEGAILLVAGRVDHRGDEASVLADLATTWEDALVRGPGGFAQDVAAGDRSRGARRPWQGRGSNGNGHGHANGNDRPVGVAGVSPGPGSAPATAPAAPAAWAGQPAAATSPVGAATRPTVYVSPLRGGGPPPAPAVAAASSGAAPPPEPAEPIATYEEPSGAAPLGAEQDEPPLPDEARARAAASAAAATAPLEAGPSGILHVRFATSAGADRVVQAMEEVRRLLRSRPGGTRVVVHVPQGAATLPMELRAGVAYDAELLAEVGRRIGGDLVRLELAPSIG
ncbi:MAG TPA: OB-fold nucleic acid binding domain-containing protein, partial [Candidatus Limnocylindrales bacterium]